MNSENFGIQIWQEKNLLITTNLKLRQNSLNQIFNPCAFFFFLLTCSRRYYHATYIVFTYFASFTGYQDDIFEVIFNLHVQVSKFGGTFDKFCELLTDPV